MPEHTLSSTGALSIPRVLADIAFTAGTSEAIRLIKQNGVRINGEKVEDPKQTITVGTSVIIQVGKRKFARVTVKK